MNTEIDDPVINHKDIEFKLNHTYKVDKHKGTSESQQVEDTRDNQEGEIEEIENSMLFNPIEESKEEVNIQKEIDQMERCQPWDPDNNMVTPVTKNKFWQSPATTISSPFTHVNKL